MYSLISLINSQFIMKAHSTLIWEKHKRIGKAYLTEKLSSSIPIHIIIILLMGTLLMPLRLMGQCHILESYEQLAEFQFQTGYYKGLITMLDSAKVKCPEKMEEIMEKTIAAFNRIDAEIKSGRRDEIANSPFFAENRNAILSDKRAFFYNQKFGLMLRQVKLRDKLVYRYGYINPKGEVLIPFEFEQASPFDHVDGYARVVYQGDDYLLDTTGTRYLLANSIDALRPETQALDLRNQNFETLPEKIGDYPSLEILLAYYDNGTFNLRDGNMTSLPASIGKLKHLTVLSVYNHQLKTLPPEIGKLEKLKYLNLGGNQLKSIPNEIGQLESLEDLQIWGNEIEQLPASMANLSKLRTLALGNNQNAVPEVVFQLSGLEYLDLFGDELLELPAEIGNLIALKVLDLGQNKLQSLPLEIGKLQSLRELYLNNNEIKRLPAEIGRLHKLELLDLTTNRLVGLPEQIGQLKNLRELILISNQLGRAYVKKGNQDPSLGWDFQNLEQVPKGKIRDQIAQSMNYEVNPDSLLPASMGNLMALEELSLDFNQLHRIPTEIGNLVNLQKLSIAHNKLKELPNLVQAQNLIEIGLGNNQLRKFPEGLHQLPVLYNLNLSNNQIRDIPASAGDFQQLEVLRLDGNGIKQLPIELCSSSDFPITFSVLDSLTEDCRRAYYQNRSEEIVSYYLSYTFNNKRYEEAYEIAQILCERFPNNYINWYNLSFYTNFVGNHELSIEAAERSLTLAPEHNGVLTNLALGYLLSGQYSKAKKIYKEWKDKNFNDGQQAGPLFWQDLDDMETAGITHPDIKKVRELLGEEMADSKSLPLFGNPH